jgi:hypothetical protein
MDSFFQAFIDALLYIPRILLSWLFDGVLFLVNSLPQTNINLASSLANVGSDIGYFLAMMEFNYGISVIFGAYIARFLLRRIPVIG